jgi:hypothetical protein
MFLLSSLTGIVSGFILGYLAIYNLSVFGVVAFLLLAVLAASYRYTAQRYFKGAFGIITLAWAIIGGFLGLIAGVATLPS